MRNYFLLISAFFLVSLTFAQNIPEDYQKAQTFLNSKNYWEAMPLFREFMDSERYGALSNYAAFHLGEAALGANQPDQAIPALLQVSNKVWTKSDESKYLLALAYFQNQQNQEALRAIKGIKKDSMKEMAENATFENLKKTSASFMVANLQEFKENKGYAAALKTVLESQTILSASERAAYYELQGNAGGGMNAVKDMVLDFVVILPFTTSPSASASSIDQSSFIFELYQGINFAVNRLKEEGKQVTLHTFDSKRDMTHLAELLKDPVIANADAIIGPIYPDEVDLVSSFAETSKIPLIHPLSNLGERFENTQYSYLFRPSVASISNGIVAALRNQNWGSKVALGYSGSSRDEKLGMLLRDQLTSAGFSIVDMQQVNQRNVIDFLQKQGIRTGMDSVELEVDQIILLTDDPSIAQPTFGLMESVNASVPFLVMDSWIGFNFANYEMLEFPNFHFISNNTPNFEADAMEQFKENFYSKNLSYPSLNATLGRELVYWLSSNMGPTKGFELRRNLDQAAFQQGKVSWGFNFQNSNNNQYVPVFKIEAGEMKPLK
ncbi:ABC transporter substrate-binding protein [Algoriphagus sp.]|uniref:ABC transporter substrate-binding protein n=1 Tax=Algoriphagus sp. TaxID=1872435 RepID=UPI0025EA031D|nr:ABC transporter substrate-binding protein [Algoriphagus sp.]